MAVVSECGIMSRIPVIVILGATGSGKSKLGIELAKKFGGEIVSADSMQVYKGLDIITNKVTFEERLQAPHHMLDVVDPLQRFTVVDFRNRALNIIENMLKHQKLPLVVGGTHYYIESLLWKMLIEEGPDSDSELLMYDLDTSKRQSSVDGGVAAKRVRLSSSGECSESVRSEGVSGGTSEVQCSSDGASDDDSVQQYDSKTVGLLDEAALERIPSLELHRHLEAVDPEMAHQLHPHDRRKVIRSLQVFAKSGKTMSELLKAQRSEDGGSELGGPLRFPHSAILWLQCEQEVLNRRLDARVDTMLEQGLVKELLEFHKRYNEQRLATNTEANYTKGIFQSIGFKEFHEYLVLSAEERESEKGKKLLGVGVEALKMVTRRYARRQLRWINNRFLRRPSRQVPPVYGLNATDPSQWDKYVLEPAVKIVESYMKGSKPTGIEPLPKEDKPPDQEKVWHHCDVCDRVFVITSQYKQHLQSKKHLKMIKRKEKLAKLNSQGAENEQKPD